MRYRLALKINKTIFRGKKPSFANGKNFYTPALAQVQQTLNLAMCPLHTYQISLSNTSTALFRGAAQRRQYIAADLSEFCINVDHQFELM